MPNITINLSKWYHYVMALAPLVAMLASAWFWFDARYMHRQISDTRFIEVQIMIVQGHVRDYNRIIDSDGIPTANDTVQYELDLDRLKNLMSERNKILGIGGLPQ